MKRSKVIRTVKDLKALAKRMNTLEEFAFDTETNTLRVYADNDHFRLVGVSISWSEYHNYYIPTGHIFDADQVTAKQVRKYLKPIFEKPYVRIIGHNLKFDMHVLARIGIKLKTMDLFDTMIASWICNENTPNGLKQQTQDVLGIDQTKIANVLDTVTGDEKKSVGLKANNKATFDLTRIEVASPYAIDDSYYTWCLYQHYLYELEKEGMDKIYFRTYPKLIQAVFKMEERGISLDIDKLDYMDVEMNKDIEELEYKLLEIAGCQLNPGSKQQLGQLLFGFDGYKNVDKTILACNFGLKPIKQTKTGQPSTDGDTLGKLAKQSHKNKRKMEGVEFCKTLVEYNKLVKLKSFVKSFAKEVYPDGKIHCNLNIIGTDSGRMSCSSPNLQQLPNAGDEDKYQIRSLFIGDKVQGSAKRESILSVDYSNLEVRVMAHFSEDPGLINAFLGGKDLHGNTAKMMFNLECDANEVKKLHPDLRQVGKVIAFLLQYGGSPNTLKDTLTAQGEDLEAKAKEMGLKNAKEVAQKYYDMYFAGFPGIADFMKSQKKYVHRNGFIYTLVGRKRRLPEVFSSNYGEVGYAERLSVNACIQGSGADIMMNAQLNIDSNKELEELGCKMLVQIHDELVFSCPTENCDRAVEILRECMNYPFGRKVQLNCPLDIGAGYGLTFQTGH